MKKVGGIWSHIIFHQILFEGADVFPGDFGRFFGGLEYFCDSAGTAKKKFRFDSFMKFRIWFVFF